MAGVRHHIIPQFLLKGFAGRSTSKSAFTWVYRKGAEPFATNIINVNVESRFYDKDADTTADDVITDLETGFATAVDELRNSVGPVDVGQIPSFMDNQSRKGQ
jgi:hypothetical protein